MTRTAAGAMELHLDSSGWARLVRAGRGRPLWTGTLLPALELAFADGTKQTLTASTTTVDGGSIGLDFGEHARGSARWVRVDGGANLEDLELELGAGVRLIALWFGLAPYDRGSGASVSPDQTAWPDWRADEFCVPSARPAPAASFFRRWDLGQASVALGAFGPSLGAPYGAAFPRPVLASGFGDDDGWLVIGCGELPDAAVTLEVRATSAAMRWLYREDLWGPAGRTRFWSSALRVRWDDDAWGAWSAYQDSFPDHDRAPVESAALSTWNTWGDFLAEDYRLAEQIAATAEISARTLVIDDRWESWVSSGRPHRDRFPSFDADLVIARERGLEIGFWQSVGWVADLDEAGLTRDDVLLDVEGEPVRANWAMDPRDPAAHWALDPSSPRARAFLERRTRALIQEFRPRVLKLDFGYGLPDPNVAVPRDPAVRGERMSDAFYRVITEAARDEDPSVAILMYGIHPLYVAHADVISLDDMGDHGRTREGEGHRHWSVWAALLSHRNVVLAGSSGYDWSQDHEVLLDTAVLGSPGAVLSLVFDPPTARQRAARRALNTWHRPFSRWHPLWLDSHRGNAHRQPEIGSWGRLEMRPDGDVLAALALRAGHAGIDGISHDGSWALLALDDSDLRTPRGRVAVVPLTPGVLRIAASQPPVDLVRRIGGIDGPPNESVQYSNGVLEFTAQVDELDQGLEGWVVQYAG